LANHGLTLLQVILSFSNLFTLLLNGLLL